MTCDLNHSEDQRQILNATAALLEAKFPLSRLRNGGHDHLEAIAEFGAFVLAQPEDRGGGGFTVVEEILLNVLFGRHLISTSCLATSVAVRLASELGRKSIAEQVAAGTARICAAVPAANSILLVDADGADLAVIFGKRRLTLIDIAQRKGEPVTGLGHSVGLSRLQLKVSDSVGECTGGALLEIVDLLVSAQLLGIAEATRDLAVSYAKLRHQFGRPIGSFQAIKHQCSDMVIAAEMLSSLLDMAAITHRGGREDAAFQIAALRLIAPKVALGNARTCIQIHGGIGFSAEADAHHYLKQAHVLRRLGEGLALCDLPAPLAPYVRRSPFPFPFPRGNDPN